LLLFFQKKKLLLTSFPPLTARRQHRAHDNADGGEKTARMHDVIGAIRQAERLWRTCMFGAALAAIIGAQPARADLVLYLQPEVDGQTVNGIVKVIVTPNGAKLAAADLQKIGLRPSLGADAGNGERLFPPTGPVSLTIDQPRQIAKFRVPGADLAPQSQILAKPGAPLLPTAQNTGAYASYDLTLAKPFAAPGGAEQNPVDLAGGVEFVLFGPPGSLVTQTNIDAPKSRFSSLPPIARLSTTYEFDDPAGPTALRLGDVITASPGWARDNLAGGVQWGTDDALQPARRTFPTPQIGGTLADPSAVSLLVNNARAYNTNLAAGPFSLVGVPVVTGLNEITVQTRDANGQISSTTVPFYASGTMLQAGLSRYSVTAGYLRQNYGTARDGYRIAAFDGSYSFGVTNTLTATVHAEDSARLQLLGGAVETAGYFGDLTAAAAGSRADGRGGALLSLQFARSAEIFNIAGGVTYAIPGYVDLAAENGEFFPRLNWYASAGAALPFRLGSLHLAYTVQQYGTPVFPARNGGAAGGNSRFLLASYSKELFGGWSADISLSMGSFTSAGRRTTSQGISAGLSLPLGGNRRGQASFSDGTGTAPEYGEEASALPNQAVGWGAAAQNETGSYTSRDVTFQANTLAGDVSAQVNQFEGQSAAQLQARGSLALLDGLHISAPINAGFAVFDVGYANVPVFLENRPEGETDAQGRAFLPGLLPYYPNRISVSPAALPLTANFKTSTITVVPPLYGGVVATLPVSQLTGVLIRLTLPGGQHPPVGAVLHMAGDAGTAVVGYDGEALLAQAPAQLEGYVGYPGGRCTVAAALHISLQNYLLAVPVACAPSH
jgi:outer membrane usher protein